MKRILSFAVAAAAPWVLLYDNPNPGWAIILAGILSVIVIYTGLKL